MGGFDASNGNFYGTIFMKLRDFKSAKERRNAVEAELSVSLPHTGSFTLDESVAGAKHCEQMIGATQIPLGIAGPLRIKSLTQPDRQCYIPLATTEGALVASVNRGCRAISESGGAVSLVFRIGTSRGLVFRTEGIESGSRIAEMIYAQKNDLDAVAQRTSHHIRLSDVTVKTVGRLAYVRLVFDTQDAMGMNMATIASEAVGTYITEQTGARCISVAGNYDIDKKPAWLNVIRGRGWEARAEVVIPERVLRDVLKTNAAALYEVWLAKCMVGSALAGSMAFNAHYANIVAALFIATGQDPAHITEGSLGMTTVEIVNEKDAYISVYMPDLMVGTVGGGTGLATQKEALNVLGVKTGQQLAEVVAAAVLAGETSLLGALAQGALATAHRRLGRGEAV